MKYIVKHFEALPFLYRIVVHKTKNNYNNKLGHMYKCNSYNEFVAMFVS